MKRLILPFCLSLLSLNAFSSPISYGVKDVSLSRNLDETDGACSGRSTVEIFVDVYSLTPEKFRTPESRVYGTVDVKQFKTKTFVNQRSSDWTLTQKKNLLLDKQGNFTIQAEVIDSDNCGLGAWPLGRVVFNHDKTLIKKSIVANVKDIQWQKSAGGTCVARLPLADKSGVVSTQIVLEKDC